MPAIVIIAGPSGSGKSELVENPLKEKKCFIPLLKKWSTVTIDGNLGLIV